MEVTLSLEQCAQSCFILILEDCCSVEMSQYEVLDKHVLGIKRNEKMRA